MAKPILTFASLVVFSVSLMQISHAQVTIAPTSLFIDEQNRFGTFLVLNGSDQTQEVELEFVFGYPTTDDEGNIFMEYGDDEAEDKYSIADWIRGFPRSFTLEPDERQTVRLTVQPPQDLDDGTYWTRIRTTSNALSPDVDDEDTDGVTARIAFQFEQISAGFFKKGDVNTGLEIKDTEVRFSGDEAAVLAHVERDGNSPFLGTEFISIENADGEVLYREDNSLAVYLDAVRRTDFNISDFPEGQYTANIRFETTRSDIEDEDLVQTDPVSASFDFSIE